jgi:hypothetical protein
MTGLIGQKRICTTCNEEVEIINIISHDDYDEQVFSCGHRSKYVERKIDDTILINDILEKSKMIKIELISSASTVPVELSGDAGIKVTGLMPSIFNINIENGNFVMEKPRIYNLSKHTGTATPTTNLHDILVQLDKSNRSPEVKAKVNEILDHIDKEIKSKPFAEVFLSLSEELESWLPVATPYLMLYLGTFMK